jgi:hypothetical protein
MPSNPDHTALVIEADEGWSFDRAVLIDPAARCVLWGRLSDRSPLPEASRRAVDRRRALRTLPPQLPPGWRILGIHPVPPRKLRGQGPRARLAAAVRTGALVELTRLPSGHRILDAIAATAGATRSPRRIHFGAGGALVAPVTLARGPAAVLRIGRSGTAADPAPVAATLERLAAAGVVLAPVVLAQGSALGASWLAESALPGHRPARLTPALAAEVAEACGRLPIADAPPSALIEDLAGIARHLPEHSAALFAVSAGLEPRLQGWPGVFRHGDLWTGNLLVERGRLSALLDWDAAHPAAVPGADLVHLFAIEALGRRGTRLGATFLARPWRSRRFLRASSPYWSSLGLSPAPELLDLAGVAWWAAAVHGTLNRFPARATDEQWLAANVHPVLASVA